MATVKQKLVAKKVLKGTPIAKAMREAGYSKSTATTTGKITRSNGWKELMDKYISDDLLAKVHNEGLQDKDANTRHKYLETGYKVKQKYDPATVNINLVDVDIEII